MPALIGEVGWQVVLDLMALAGAAGLIAGAVLILRPHWLARAGKHVNRWVSMRRVDRPLESWRSLDEWFYRNHRLAGALMVVAAVWVIVQFTADFDREATAAALARGAGFSLPLTEVLLHAFVLICVVGTVFGVLVGLLLVARPALLREFNQGANRWFSMRKATKPVAIPRSGMDQYVLQHARVSGALLLLGGLYILGALLLALR